ncbi:SDR family oxidoreductase [Leeia sp. TBRC 13508]|uniref:SDR family oxidoreductase n=1 Tax=Leeia speluncae TaxID=2884804 RepID=A0ABS8D9K3_9NEIS|nr:SDR family oxidoreductase [Leeia speluncae]MCB6184708.1 SDR family oxidoreductase [Leeia speluncae]
MQKDIWITGATGAIGSALAKQLAMNGHRLILSAREAARLETLQNTLSGEHLVLPLDVNQPIAVENAISQMQSHGFNPSGLCHAVGSTLIKPLHLTSLDDCKNLFEQNYFSAFSVLKAFVVHQLKQKQSAAAVLIGSLVASAGFPNHEAIASAKAAVASLGQTTAATYADKGIRVNVLMPGLTQSALSARLTGTPEATARNAKMNPMGMIGEGIDTAALAAFLLGEEARWITGQVIGVDGGHAVIHPLPKA